MSESLPVCTRAAHGERFAARRPRTVSAYRLAPVTHPRSSCGDVRAGNLDLVITVLVVGTDAVPCVIYQSASTEHADRATAPAQLGCCDCGSATCRGRGRRVRAGHGVGDGIEHQQDAGQRGDSENVAQPRVGRGQP